jgi:hypothetical protein
MTAEDYETDRVYAKDPEVGEIISTDYQKSGLLNKSLQAWIRLEKRGHFPKKWNNPEYIKGLWMIDINPVKLFVDECCLLSPDYEVDYELFFKCLNRFREEHKAEPITKNVMTRRMKDLDIPGFDPNKRVREEYNPGSCGRNYVGLKIKDEILEKFGLENETDTGQEKIDIDKLFAGGTKQ